MNATENSVYELRPMYDSRNSFYGKATVIVNPDKAIGDEHVKILKSYDTIVSSITADGRAKVFGLHSATTLRHIKEFLLQHNFKVDSKAQIIRDYME
jgi:hypothetical protein